MSADSRKNTRRDVRNGARLVSADGSALGPCMMADLSATGARLQVDAPDALPDEFFLLLSHTGQLRRKCSVAWRTENAIGVKFMPGPPPKRRKPTIVLGPAAPNP
jgi:hypothetical protein